MSSILKAITKKRRTYQFRILVHGVECLRAPLDVLAETQRVLCKCSRNSKVYYTELLPIEHGSVIWNTVLTFFCSLYLGPRGFAEKKFTLSVQTENGSIKYETTIDLAQYAAISQDIDITRTFDLQPSGVLKLSIKSQEVDVLVGNEEIAQFFDRDQENMDKVYDPLSPLNKRSNSLSSVKGQYMSPLGKALHSAKMQFRRTTDRDLRRERSVSLSASQSHSELFAFEARSPSPIVADGPEGDEEKQPGSMRPARSARSQSLNDLGTNQEQRNRTQMHAEVVTAVIAVSDILLGRQI